jgi:hypothetical protein
MLYRHAQSESNVIMPVILKERQTMAPEVWKPKFLKEFLLNFTDLHDADLSELGRSQTI